jgi:hypothetical protein
MNIAVLGIGNIGKFHVREYLNNNCNVVAILESSLKIASEKKDLIAKEYGISVNGYTNLNELLLKEKLDAVSICTPPSNHYNQVKICLENNLHVLCEKPFIIGKDNLKLAKELFKLSKEKKKVLTVNTQWPSVLDSIKNIIGSNPIESFSFYMEPGLKGIGLLTEALPHANSMLLRLLGSGEIKNLVFLEKEDEKILLKFDYIYGNNSCNVTYNIRYKQDRPRKVYFSINNKEFIREVLENGEQVLIHSGKAIAIEDPFKVSIRKFIESLNGKCSPLVCEREILENLRLQNLICNAYLK